MPRVLRIRVCMYVLFLLCMVMHMQYVMQYAMQCGNGYFKHLLLFDFYQQ